MWVRRDAEQETRLGLRIDRVKIHESSTAVTVEGLVRLNGRAHLPDSMKVKAQCFGADGDPLFGDSTYMDDSVGSTATFTLRLGRWSSHSSSDVAGIRIALEDPMFSEPWWNFSERNRDALPPLLRNSSWTHEENRAAKSVEDLLCNALGRDAFRSNFYSVIPPATPAPGLAASPTESTHVLISCSSVSSP